MPAECKHCGEEVRVLSLIWHRLRHGRYPECEGCGADDNTLELRAEAPSSDD